MASIEDLVRESLRQRAEDVEATPALWLEVDRRVSRRRRFQVLTWSLAGVAAALAAVAVVPGLLGGGTGPGLQIEPMDRMPVAGVVPGTAVVADGEELSLLDLSTGELSEVEIGYGEVVQIAVQPGSTTDDYRIAVVQSDETDPAQLSFRYASDRGVSGTLAEHAVEPSFVPTIAWSPEGDLVAYTVPADDGGASLLIQDAPGATDGFLEPSDAIVVTTLDEGDVLLDWVGAVTEQGDRSELRVRRTDGTVGVVSLRATGIDGEFRTDGDAIAVPDGWGGTFETRVQGAVAVVSGAPAVPDAGPPLYALAPGSDGGAALFWIGRAQGDAGDTPVVEVPLAELFGDADAGELWLDAKQDAALVGDGEQVWLLAHDGRGAFTQPVRISDGLSVAALFDAVRPGAGDDAQDEATQTPGDPAPSEPGTDPGDGTTTGADLPEPIVTVSAQELTLVGPSGPVTLATLADEGESRFVSARVRPGSTVDDLTVVALTTAEGMYDLRHLHLVDGDVVTWQTFEQPHTPGFGGAAGEGVSAWGPVWSPDGEHLAWFEFGTGPATLRTIGWDGGPGTGDPVTDNATFSIDGLPGQPLLPMEWVNVPGTPGSTEIRGTLLDSTDGWLAVPLEIQADGAIAQPADTSAVVVEPAPAGGQVGAVAGARDDAGIRFMVLSTFEGAELLVDPYGDPERIGLPTEILPGDGLPEYWVRAIGDGALVGSPNTSLAWFVAPDGTLNRLAGQVVDADVVN